MVAEMPAVDREIDLRDDTAIELVRDAFDTLIQRRNRILRVIGESPKDASVLAVVVLDEQPLQEEMFGYSKRILGLSIVIALATASALYFSLQFLLVRPMRRLTQRMVGFHPEAPATDVPPNFMAMVAIFAPNFAAAYINGVAPLLNLENDPFGPIHRPRRSGQILRYCSGMVGPGR